MVLVTFLHHFVIQNILAIASQNHVSQILLLYKSLHNNCDICFDEMVLIFLKIPLQNLI